MTSPEPLDMIRSMLADDPSLRDLLWLALEESPLAFRRDWPYADLPRRCPVCPMCGEEGRMLVAANVVPMAFCDNDDCQVFQYDPTKSAFDNLKRAGFIVEDTAPDGSMVWHTITEDGVS